MKKTALPKTWVSALFKKFQARYGSKWVACIDGIEVQAVNEWAEGLANLTGEQIAQGLELWSEDWPPSLPEFKNACLKKQKGLGHNSAAYKEFPKSLPKPPKNKELGKSKLDELREALK